jgi:O-antigen ligase
MVDKYALIPILACVYATIVGPLTVYDTTIQIQNAEPGLANRLFWPAMAAVSVVLAVQNRSRLRSATLPPHIKCLLAYIAFAGASVLWAYSPAISFVRYAQQLMVLISIVLPGMLAARTADLMRGVFLCFALAAILNVFFVFDNPPSAEGYSGYFGGKNYLGEFAAVAFLLSLHEMLYPGLRRALGFIVVVIATLLLLGSQSKTAFGLALICPLLAGLILIIRKTMRISVAVVLLFISFFYNILSSVSGFNMNRVSFMLYGDSTFTGRTIIWDFAEYEIGQRPLLGWGYQSFWLVGSDAPSVVS